MSTWRCWPTRQPSLGGYIRNAALSATLLVAEEGTAVTMMHLVKSVGREYEKLGKLFSEADFFGI